MVYRLALYVHVFSAIVSLGPFFALLPVLRRMRTAENVALNAYLDVFQTTIRMIKHAGHLLVLSGLVLIYLGSWPWTTFWIAMTIAVMISSLIFLAKAFKPALSKFKEEKLDQNELVNKLLRSTWIYIILLMLMLFFMVVKPVLW